MKIKTHNRWFIMGFLMMMVVLPILSTNASAMHHPESQSTLAEIETTMDSYVQSYYPSDNFGGQDWLYSGQGYENEYITYFYFDLSSAPDQSDYVYLQLDISSLYETMNLSICLYESTTTWDEYSITYMNRPTEVIDQVNLRIFREDVNYLDVSDLIPESYSQCTLSINASILHENKMTIVSREDDFSIYENPTLIYSSQALYPEYDDPSLGKYDILPEADSYIHSDAPFSNYGGISSLKAGIGYSDDFYLALFHFESIPTDASEMAFLADIGGIYSTHEACITVKAGDDLVEWEEMELNYFNWPYGDPVDFIDSSNTDQQVLIPASDVYEIDLSEYCGEDSLDIIISMDIMEDDYIYIYSKECSSLSDPPIIQTDIEAPIDEDPDESSNENSEGSSDDINIAGYTPAVVLISCVAALFYIRRVNFQRKK